MYFMNVTVYTIETTQMTLKHLADAFSPLSTNKFCPLLAKSAVASNFTTNTLNLERQEHKISLRG